MLTVFPSALSDDPCGEGRLPGNSPLSLPLPPQPSGEEGRPRDP